MREILEDLRWRISDTRDQLLRRTTWDESYHSLDEWSGPIVNMNLMLELIDQELNKE